MLKHAAIALALLIPTMVCSTAVVASPATAANGYPSGTATVSVSDAYLPIGDCAYHDYSISISTSFDTRSWSADVTVEGPYGEYVASDFFYGNGSSYETGTIFLCGNIDPTGSYSVDVDLELTDSDYDTWTGSGALEFFDVRKQTPRVFASLSDSTPRKGQVVTIKVRAYGRQTGEPIAYGDVSIQRRVAGRWVTLAWSKTTLDARGRTTVRGRAQQTITLRARVLGGNSYGSATSRPVTMRLGG
jgi:hypothetical protein